MERYEILSEAKSRPLGQKKPGLFATRVSPKTFSLMGFEQAPFRARSFSASFVFRAGPAIQGKVRESTQEWSGIWALELGNSTRSSIVLMPEMCYTSFLPKNSLTPKSLVLRRQCEQAVRLGPS